jgi:hypothetical protein
MPDLGPIRRSAPGTIVHTAFPTPDGRIELGFAVRESSAVLNRFSPDSEVTICAGAFQKRVWMRRVIVVPFLITLGSGTDQLVYDTWVDEWHSNDWHPIETLANQEQIVVGFFGDRDSDDRHIIIENKLRHFAQHTLGKISSLWRWGPATFRCAARQVMKDFPTAEVLAAGVSAYCEVIATQKTREP